MLFHLKSTQYIFNKPLCLTDFLSFFYYLVLCAGSQSVRPAVVEVYTMWRAAPVVNPDTGRIGMMTSLRQSSVE